MTMRLPSCTRANLHVIVHAAVETVFRFLLILNDQLIGQTEVVTSTQFQLKERNTARAHSKQSNNVCKSEIVPGLAGTKQRT